MSNNSKSSNKKLQDVFEEAHRRAEKITYFPPGVKEILFKKEKLKRKK